MQEFILGQCEIPDRILLTYATKLLNKIHNAIYRRYFPTIRNN